MKKLISLLILSSLVLGVFIGCSKNSCKYDCPFVDIRWTRSGESDTEYIRFSSKGEFSYYCACGNSLNDSDLCTGYRYDGKTNTITLNYLELTAETVIKIVVVKCTESELVLDFEGDIRTFKVDKEAEYCDEITYNGDKYLLIEYADDVFYYSFNTEVEYEENTVYEILNDKWNVIYYNGKIFALACEMSDIQSYYADDDNYEWCVIIENVNTDDVLENPINLSNEEMTFIYSLEDAPRIQTVLFDEIEIFGTLCKTSNDGLIIAKTDLLYYAGNWYWRTDEVDESAGGWPEYVVLLSESINIKLKLNQ